ncbi:MAG: hypothetical protein K9I68_07225 [Bacteroidales bacterium]|nr:hypothetical protein [Bacteroidales bacterium]MCF8337985.1 hypothetical protein [Bacteroidales bacterium]
MKTTSFLIAAAASLILFFSGCETEDDDNTTGGSWKAVETPTSNWLKDISFVDDVTGWAVGKSGALLKTEDGESWDTFSITGITDDDLYGIAFSDTENGVIIGDDSEDGAFVYATRNGGVSWTEKTLPEIGFIPRAVAFAGDSKGWITGSDGVVLHTTDAGQSWSRQETPVSNSLYAIETVGTNKVYLAGSSVLLVSTDAGSSWQPLISEPDDFGWLSDVAFADDNHGWLVTAGGEGKIYHTEDGGNSWSLQLDAEVDYLSSIFVSEDFHGWAVGESGTIYQTKNGEDWATIENPVSYDLNAVYFPSNVNGWAGGYSGTLLHYN